jgi:hypothetical protein
VPSAFAGDLVRTRSEPVVLVNRSRISFIVLPSSPDAVTMIDWRTRPDYSALSPRATDLSFFHVAGDRAAHDRVTHADFGESAREERPGAM